MAEVQTMNSALDALNLAPEDNMDAGQEQQQQQIKAPLSDESNNNNIDTTASTPESATEIQHENAFPSLASDTSPPLTHQQIIALNTLAQLTPIEGNDVQSRLLRQVEFYFSDTNLPRDKFLKHLLGLEVNNAAGQEGLPADEASRTSPVAAPESPTTSSTISPSEHKYVPLEILMGFNKIKSITEDIEVLRQAIRKSAGLIKMNADETGVTRTTPLPEKPQKDKKKRRKSKPKVLELGVPGDKDQVFSSGSTSRPTSTPNTPLTPAEVPFVDELDLRTVLAECLPQGYDRAAVEKDFGKYGPIESIDLDSTQGTTGRGGIAQIVFAKLEDAQRALADLEEVTKGGSGENDWRRQSMKVKSKKDWLVNKNVNTRNRRGSVSSTGATMLLNAGIPLVPAAAQSLTQQPQQTRRPSLGRRSSISGSAHVEFNPQVTRREYQPHIVPNYSFGDSGAVVTNVSLLNNGVPVGILSNGRRKSTDAGQPSAQPSMVPKQRRMSVSNVIGGGNVSFSTSSLQPQGQSLQPAQQQATQPLSMTRRSSLAENLQRNRQMSQHGILSVCAPTGAVQNNYRVVYARGPDNSRGFARAAGRGKSASGAAPQHMLQPASVSQ